MRDSRLGQAGIGPSDVDAIAVTAGPGLATGLQTGLAAAKSYALALNNPLYGLLIADGVAANSRLRQVATDRCVAAGITLRVPRPQLCTDNGAMIAAVGDLLISANTPPSPLGLAADPSAPLTRASLNPGRL